MVRKRREAVLCQSGSRVDAGRRLVDARSLFSLFLLTFLSFISSFPLSHLSLSCLSSLSLSFPLFLSHLSLDRAGRRLTDAMFPFSSLAVYELSSPFLHSSFLSLSLVPPSSWTSRRYNSSISCLSHLSHSHLHLHGKP